jgi:integrase
MTRVRVGKNDNSQQSKDRKRRPVISDGEFKEMLSRAGEIKNGFYRLRSLAILCILKRTGKRRGELASLKRENVTVEGDKLQIRFTLEKKKRHFKLCSNCQTEDKPTKNPATSLFCKKCGINIEANPIQTTSLETESLKSIYLADPLAKHITNLQSFLESLDRKTEYFFPASRDVFGAVVILQDAGVKGRQIYNLVHALNSELWPHLFRDTVGAEIVRADSSLFGLFKVLTRLDLENLETARRYVKRYVGEVIEVPEGITA